MAYGQAFKWLKEKLLEIEGGMDMLYLIKKISLDNMDKPWTPVSVHHLKTQIIAYINTMIDINTRMNIFIVVIDQNSELKVRC